MALPPDGSWLIGLASGAGLGEKNGAALAVDDPWLSGLANVVLVASAATWIYLVAKWLRDGVLLAYFPRRPVPWGPVATVMALSLAVLTIASGQTLGEAEPPAVAQDSADAAWQLTASVLPVVLLTAGFALTIALFSRALPCDLGFPASAGELVRDSWLGVITCLAAVLPVFGALGLLRYFFDLDEVSHHPLIEIVGETKNSGLLLLATAITVLVAPVCEEVTFRLLLQGWLEKKWDVVDRSAAKIELDVADDAAAAQLPTASTAEAHAAPYGPRPSGWIPILISAVVFAAAHFGYGPEPVPIFILALILGFVYRQTHRIVPCIVAHAMFNSFSMLILWRMVFLDSE